MPRASDARPKAIATAERLFREQGYAATGLTQIIDESGAPKGSFYFHFPGGKRQLAMEVLDAYSEWTTRGFRDLAAHCQGDGDRFVRGLARGLSREMEQSDWSVGCIAQTFAQEMAPADEEARVAIAALLDGWTEVVAEALAPGGASRPDIRGKATALIAALQGARTLARAQRSPAAFDAVAANFQSGG